MKLLLDEGQTRLCRSQRHGTAVEFDNRTSVKVIAWLKR
jgi:hypothetical protein